MMEITLHLMTYTKTVHKNKYAIFITPEHIVHTLFGYKPNQKVFLFYCQNNLVFKYNLQTLTFAEIYLNELLVLM